MMGLLSTIVAAPMLAPFKGVLWVVETIAGHAEREFYNEDKIRKDLVVLEQQFELGKLSMEEFESIESELLERLNHARRMNEGR